MSHACVHLNYKRNLLKKADGLRKRKHGLISPLTWPIFDGKAVFNERNIHPSPTISNSLFSQGNTVSKNALHPANVYTPKASFDNLTMRIKNPTIHIFYLLPFPQNLGKLTAAYKYVVVSFPKFVHTLPMHANSSPLRIPFRESIKCSQQMLMFAKTQGSKRNVPALPLFISLRNNPHTNERTYAGLL